MDIKKFTEDLKMMAKKFGWTGGEVALDKKGQLILTASDKLYATILSKKSMGNLHDPEQRRKALTRLFYHANKARCKTRKEAWVLSQDGLTLTHQGQPITLPADLQASGVAALIERNFPKRRPLKRAEPRRKQPTPKRSLTHDERTVCIKLQATLNSMPEAFTLGHLSTTPLDRGIQVYLNGHPFTSRPGGQTNTYVITPQNAQVLERMMITHLLYHIAQAIVGNLLTLSTNGQQILVGGTPFEISPSTLNPEYGARILTRLIKTALLTEVNTEAQKMGLPACEEKSEKITKKIQGQTRTLYKPILKLNGEVLVSSASTKRLDEVFSPEEYQAKKSMLVERLHVVKNKETASAPMQEEIKSPEKKQKAVNFKAHPQTLFYDKGVWDSGRKIMVDETAAPTNAFLQKSNSNRAELHEIWERDQKNDEKVCIEIKLTAANPPKRAKIKSPKSILKPPGGGPTP